MMPTKFGICLPELLGGGKAVLAVQGTTQRPSNRLAVLVAMQGDVVGKGLTWSIERSALSTETPALSRWLLGHQLVLHHPLLSN